MKKLKIKKYSKGVASVISNVKPKQVLGDITKLTGSIADIAGLYSATSGDEKAAKVADTFNNISSTTGVIGNEMQKDKEGMSDVAGSYMSGNTSAIIKGATQIKDNGTSLSDVKYKKGLKFKKINKNIKPSK